jgi:parallel beta-helix repeat protein
VIGNVAFRNREVGISVEDSVGTQVMGNRMLQNGEDQLLFLKSRDHQSEGNCFDVSSGQATGRLEQARHADLAAFQQASGQDRGSRAGDCGALPETLDVQGLHAEALRNGARSGAKPASTR